SRGEAIQFYSFCVCIDSLKHEFLSSLARNPSNVTERRTSFGALTSIPSSSSSSISGNSWPTRSVTDLFNHTFHIFLHSVECMAIVRFGMLTCTRKGAAVAAVSIDCVFPTAIAFSCDFVPRRRLAWRAPTACPASIPFKLPVNISAIWY
ncbi:unnamed protein product, partial [Rhizoctonia solani]